MHASGMRISQDGKSRPGDDDDDNKEEFGEQNDGACGTQAAIDHRVRHSARGLMQTVRILGRGVKLSELSETTKQQRLASSQYRLLEEKKKMLDTKENKVCQDDMRPEC